MYVCLREGFMSVYLCKCVVVCLCECIYSEAVMNPLQYCPSESIYGEMITLERTEL